MFNETVQKLNNVSKDTEAVSSSKAAVFTRFYYGNTWAKLAPVIRTLAPSGKVTCVYTKASFEKFGAETHKLIVALTGKPYDFVVDADFVGENGETRYFPSTDDAGKLLCAAENARFVLTFDNELFGLVTYAAMIAKIPAAIVLTSAGFCDVVPSRTILKNGRSFQYVKVRAPRYVILDENIAANTDVAGAYCSVISRLADFADYRIARAAGISETDKRAYSLMKDSVSSAFGIFSLSKTERAERILTDKLTAELANLASDGQLSDYSAVRNASRLCLTRGLKKESESPYIFRRIMGLLDLCLSGEYDEIVETPDYLMRADKLAVLTGSDDGVFLKAFKRQRDLLSANEKAVHKIKQTLKDEIKAQNAAAEKSLQTYFALGGRDETNKAEINAAVKYCGDLERTFNSMTLVRESGIAEYF